MSMHCVVCGKRAYSEYCVAHKPRKPIVTRKLPKKIGERGKKLATYVEAWKQAQKPDANGLYTCYISGEKVSYLMAEHPYSKARHPELRTNQTLEPVSAEINKLKGSLDIDEFLRKYPEYQKTVKKEYLEGI